MSEGQSTVHLVQEESTLNPTRISTLIPTQEDSTLNPIQNSTLNPTQVESTLTPIHDISTLNPIQEVSTDISPAEKSEIKKCFELLQQGDEIIQSGPKEATLVIGITGSGKTTLVQFLAGDNSKLVSKEAGENVGEFTIEDADHKISANSTIVSQTIFPDLIVDAQTDTAFYDCPGFSDTRGTAIDIAGTYFIRKIIQNTKKVKILMTVNYSSMRQGGDRGDFMNLVKHTLNLIEKFEKYANSIALVVTKVDNVYQNKGKTLVADESVVKYVAQFLAACQKDAGKVFANEMATKAKRLIEILSTQSEADGYERIGIFRRPDEAGPLSRIQLLQDGKAHIQEIMAKNLRYTDVSVDDFGYAISERSKNGIYEMVREINGKIRDHVNEVGLEVQKHLGATEATTTDVQKLRDEFLGAREKMRKIFDVDEESVGLSEFVEKILNFLHEFRINVEKDHVSVILQQRKYLEFLEVVGQRKLEDSSRTWTTGLSETRKYLQDSAAWYDFLSTLQDKLSSYEVQKYKSKFAPLLQNEIVDRNDKNLRLFVENHCKEIEFDEISKLNVDDVKLKKLNLLLKSTLPLNVESKYDAGSRTYEVRGDYVTLSVIDASFLQNAKFLNIFATNKVFIDQDLVRKGNGLHHTAILAPTWEVIGERKIELNGADGCCTAPFPAPNGLYQGASGYHGEPGKPGKPAGHFFGVGVNFINGRDLVINAIGGAGGAGQDGGNGAAGYNGRSPISGGDGFRKSYKGGSFLWITRSYCIYGEDGGNGGRGGDGGVGGKGGAAGDIKLIHLGGRSDVLSHSATGNHGRNGAGGAGGRMGYAGTSIKSHKLFWWSAGTSYSQDCSEYDYRRNGQDGRNGITGGNSDGEQFPEIIPTPNRLNIVNRYKEFLRASVNIETTLRATQIKFLNQLTNPEIDRIDLRDVEQTAIVNYNRRRRSVDDQPSTNNSYESVGDAEAGVPSKGEGVIKWLVNNKVSHALPITSNKAFNDNATPVPHLTNAKYNDISPPNVQYNVNDGLILTDLLVRSVTKAKPNFFHECAINYENVHQCAVNITTEFENILESMSEYEGEFDFDPVPLMSKLEKTILNGSRTNVRKVLLDAVLNKTKFNEEEFYRRLEILTKRKSK